MTTLDQVEPLTLRNPAAGRVRSADSSHRLHILLLSPTVHEMKGSDRDWVTLANALGSDQVRISWAGAPGCEYLRPYLDPGVVTRLIDVGLPWFTYLIQENAYAERSNALWFRIVADHLLRLVQPLRRLSKELSGDPVDLVVTNTAAVTLGALFAAIHRRPHVWCVKESLDPAVPACLKLARWITRLSSSVVVPSQAVAAPFAGRVAVVPDGCDVEKIQAGARSKSRTHVLDQLGLPSVRPVVAQVGGTVWWKGQHVTADAFLRLAAGGGEPLFSLLFLGRGNAEYRESLDRTLAQAPREWQEAVRFVHFDHDDFSYLGAADIVVHPSVLPDPFPNAVREAMILGKPVIASRQGGIPEMIQDGETGILVRPRDSEDLGSAIHMLATSPAERARLGESARRFATEYFDIHTRKNDFVRLFRSLVRDPRRVSDVV